MMFRVFALGAFAGIARPALAQRPVVPAAGADTAKRSTAHAPTCVAGLREYERLADVPRPFDTLRLSFATTPMFSVPMSSESEMWSFLLEQTAKVGATGFIRLRSAQNDSARSFRVTPLFVPADSQRVRAACAGRMPPTVDQGRVAH